MVRTIFIALSIIIVVVFGGLGYLVNSNYNYLVVNSNSKENVDPTTHSRYCFNWRGQRS